MELSTDLKWRVIYLTDKGYSNDDIQESLCISKSTICRVREYYRLYGTVENPHAMHPGRPKIFEQAELNV
jgi:transposase